MPAKSSTMAPAARVMTERPGSRGCLALGSFAETLFTDGTADACLDCDGESSRMVPITSPWIAAEIRKAITPVRATCDMAFLPCE